MPTIDFAQKLKEIHPMPHALVRVLNEANKSDFDIDRLEALLRHDPAFTLKILSIANSAFYGRSNIRNIRDAITLLGSTSIKNICTSICAYDLFNFTAVKYNFSGYELWKHSVGVGICASLIAEYLELNVNIDYFTIGILHDIGLIFEYQFFNEPFTAFLDCLYDDHKRLTELEEDIFRVNHAKLGQMLCNQWAVPEVIGKIVAAHHDPCHVDSTVLKPACIINLADNIVMNANYGYGYPVLDPIDESVFKFLELEKGHLKQFLNFFEVAIRDPKIPYLEILA